MPTTEYQKRAYKNWLSKVTDPNNENYDPNFAQKRRDASKKYYEKNKERILINLKKKRDQSQLIIYSP
jgi:hypothetical protein